MKKKKKILLLVGLLVLLISAAVGIYFGFIHQKQPTTESVVSKLYWNADRDQFIPELGGDTIRKPEADGLYKVRFLVEGELVEYRVADRETMISVDEKSALGLEVDENGIITKAIDIRDMGIREVAKSFYVQTMKDNEVVANSSVTGSAVDVSLRINSETNIWNVTGKVEPLGVKDKLQLMDCIRAFNNSEGQITDIFIVEREDILNGVSAERYCAHCDEVVTWRMWLGSNSLPYSSGHFRLITDVELPDQYSMPAETDVVFDLNGKTVTRKTQGRIISLHAEGDKLSIVDGSEGQKGMIKAHGEYAANGGVIWVRYGTLNLYAGTIDASEVIDAGANGAAIQVNPDTTFNMHGGKIIGGTAKPAVLKNEETREQYTSGGMGGAIYCQGTINMYGGEITGGKVVSAKDHKGEMAGIAGGNIALISQAVMNFNGGIISGGIVADPYGHGGNISVRSEGATLNINGGQIVDGVSMLQGANIASWGTITMTDGTIKNGKNMSGDSLKDAKFNEASTSHNMFLVSSKFDMSGGTVAGHIGATNGLKDKNGKEIDCNIILSGKAKIKGANTNLTAGTSMIHFGTLSGDADISVNGSGFISTDTIAANQKYVHSDHIGADVLYLEKRLFIGKQSCVCGLDEKGKHFGECDGALLAWMPWTKDTYAPTEEGNWYLLNDIELDGITEPKPKVTLRLDLNGKTITGKKDRRVYSTVNGEINLTVTDLSKEKKGCIVAMTGAQPENLGKGGCVWVFKNSAVTFYNGTLDAKKVTIPYSGAAVGVEKDCTFTMYGGTINGGKAVKEAEPNKNGFYVEGYAGAVNIIGQFNMNGGVIQGGNAEQHGGNVYVSEGGKFNMTAGMIIGGKAVNGGNISGMGDIRLSGGVIADGEAEYGGNVCARRTMVMTGGVIKDGIAKGGGNIFASDSSNLTVSGGIISGGKATTDEGGNLRIWTNSKLNISNATIRGGEAKKDGGNIYLNDLINATITNATVTNGKTSANGGNLCIGKEAWETSKFTKVIITGGSFCDGYAKEFGGNVYVRKSNTTLAGAVEILDGTMGDEATSNLYIAKDVRISLSGLTSEDASIGVYSVDSTFAKNANVNKSDVERFISDEGHPIAQTSQNEIFFGKIGCMCGNHNGSHKVWCTEDLRNIEWHTWRDDSTLPGENEKGLYYYLTSDVKLKGQLRLETKGTWGLDLNGKKVTNSDRAYNLGGSSADIKYILTDTSAAGTGTITYNEGTTKTDGMLFFIQTGTKVDFYAGTITGAGVTTTYGTTLVVSAGTFTMHDGLILPGATTSKPINGNYATNCVEVRQGTLDVKGGTIEGEVRITTVAGKLLVSGATAKVGVAVTGDAGKPYGIFALHNGGGTLTGKIELNNLNVPGQIVIKDKTDLTFTEAEGSNSSVDAIKLLDDGDGHYAVVKHNGTIRIASVVCVCGENVKGKDSHTCAWTGEGNGIGKVYDINWKPYTADGKMPSEAGYFYLTKDITLTQGTELASVTCLDLNGKTITASKNTFNIIINHADTNYSIADSKNGAGIKLPADFSHAGFGSLIVFRATGKLNLYSGVIDMSATPSVTYQPIDISQGTFCMYGGEIKPAQNKTGYSNCIGLRSSGAAIVAGGTVYGEILFVNPTTTRLTVKNDAKVGIQFGQNANYGISAWEYDSIVVCENLTEDAEIVVVSHKVKLYDAEGSHSAIKAIQYLNDGGDGHYALIEHNQQVRTASVVCVCGENVKGKDSHTCAWTGAGNGIEKVYNINWQAYTDASGELPGSGKAGYYYLTKDYTLSRSNLTTISYLDLNGKTVTASNSWNIRIESALANYSITDSKGTGTIKMPDNHSFGAWGSLIFYNYAGTFTLYNGTIDMTNVAEVPYAMIDVNKGAFVMNGGVIKGAQKGTNYSNCINARGTGTVTITGGTVYGVVLLQNAANTLTVGGNAQVGLPLSGITGNGIYAWGANTQVNCSTITEQAKIVFGAPGNVKLSDGYEIVNVSGQFLLQKKSSQ